jgi:hypothetical protein
VVAIAAGVRRTSPRLRARSPAAKPGNAAELLEHLARALAGRRRARAGRHRRPFARRHRCGRIGSRVSRANSTARARRTRRHPVRTWPRGPCATARRRTCRSGRLAADGGWRRGSCRPCRSRAGDHLCLDARPPRRAEGSAGTDATALGRPRPARPSACGRRVAAHPPRLAHRLRLLRPRPDA